MHACRPAAALVGASDARAPAPRRLAGMAVLLLLLVVPGALGAVMDSFARLAAPDPPPRPRGRRRPGLVRGGVPGDVPRVPSRGQGPGGAQGPLPGRRPVAPRTPPCACRRAGCTEAGTPPPTDAPRRPVRWRWRRCWRPGAAVRHGHTASAGAIAPAVPRAGRGGGRENRPRAPRGPTTPRSRAPRVTIDRRGWCALAGTRRGRVRPGWAPTRPCAALQLSIDLAACAFRRIAAAVVGSTAETTSAYASISAAPARKSPRWTRS